MNRLSTLSVLLLISFPITWPERGMADEINKGAKNESAEACPPESTLLTQTANLKRAVEGVGSKFRRAQVPPVTDQPFPKVKRKTSDSHIIDRWIKGVTPDQIVQLILDNPIKDAMGNGGAKQNGDTLTKPVLYDKSKTARFTRGFRPAGPSIVRFDVTQMVSKSRSKEFEQVEVYFKAHDGLNMGLTTPEAKPIVFKLTRLFDKDGQQWTHWKEIIPKDLVKKGLNVALEGGHEGLMDKSAERWMGLAIQSGLDKKIACRSRYEGSGPKKLSYSQRGGLLPLSPPEAKSITPGGGASVGQTR